MTDPIDNAIDVLNRIHEADPSVLPALINFRVPCNGTLAADPTVQVGIVHGTMPTYEVGFLGVVNGLFGVQGPKSIGYIAAVYDDEHALVCFKRNELPS